MAAFCALWAWPAAADAQSAPGAPAENRPAEINACVQLTAADVTAVTGFAARPGIRRDSGYESNGSYSSTCVWVLERDESGIDRNAPLRDQSFVILNVMRWPGGSGLADRFLQAFHKAADKGEIAHEPAPRNFGDAALWWGDGLAVRKGDVSFGISVVIPGIDQQRPGELEERLAPVILRRLAGQVD